MTKFIFPTLLIILGMLIYGMYTAPLREEIKKQLARETEVRAALADAEKAHEQLDAIAKRYENFPPDAERKLGQILPSHIDPIRLLIDTTEFLERNGFSSESVSIADTGGGGSNKNTSSYREHRISFSVSATYDTFRKFLRTIESSMALRDTSTLSFTTGDPDNDSPALAVHTYNIQVVGYSLR